MIATIIWIIATLLAFSAGKARGHIEALKDLDAMWQYRLGQAAIEEARHGDENGRGWL